MVHAGPQDEITTEGPITRVQLQRSPVKFPLDRAHDYDLIFLRHYRRLEPLLRQFRPDVVQITGPSDVGTLGAYVAHKMRIPLAASWQTNLHQYARRRVEAASLRLPKRVAGETRGRCGAPQFPGVGAVLPHSAAAVCSQSGDDPRVGSGYWEALPPDVARRGHGRVQPRSFANGPIEHSALVTWDGSRQRRACVRWRAWNKLCWRRAIAIFVL